MPIDTLNQATFKRASDLTLNLSSRSIVVFGLLGRVWPRPRNSTDSCRCSRKGRSKGCVAIGASSPSAASATTSLYGQHFADEILGQIESMFGRLECTETAEWASPLSGTENIVDFNQHHELPEVESSTPRAAEWDKTRRLVMPAKLMSTPTRSRERSTRRQSRRSVGDLRWTSPATSCRQAACAERGRRAAGSDPAFPRDQFSKRWSLGNAFSIFVGRRSSRWSPGKPKPAASDRNGPSHRRLARRPRRFRRHRLRPSAQVSNDPLYIHSNSSYIPTST